MTKTQALKAARALLGPKAFVRVNETAPSPTARASWQKDADYIKAKYTAVEGARAARFQELMRDPEHVALAKQAQRLKAEWQQAAAMTLRRKVTIGRNAGFANLICGEGDDFQAALDEATARKTRGLV